MTFTVRNVLAVLRPVRKEAGLLFAVMLVAAVFDMLGIGLLMPMMDLMLSGDRDANPLVRLVRLAGFDTRWDLALVCLLVVSGFGLKFVFVIWRGYCTGDFVCRLRQFWTSRIFENFVYSDYLKISRQKHGELTNVLVQEPIFASKGLGDIVDVCVNLLIAISMVGVMLWADWRFTVFALLLLSVGAATIWNLSSRHSVGVGKDRIHQNQEISQIVSESVSGCRQIKVFSIERRVIGELDARLDRLSASLRRFALTNAIPQPTGELMVVLLFTSGLLAQTYWYGNVNLSGVVAKVGVFVLAGMRLFNGASTLFAKRMSVLTYWPAIVLVHQFAGGGQPAGSVDDAGREFPEQVREIDVDSMSFSYSESKKLFDGLALRISRGFHALAGKSGSGKSTLCDLVAKLYSPSSGAIMANGVDLASISTAGWRSKIGYVSQDTFMFHTTIAENIRVGHPGASMDDVRMAAAMADAAEFIERLPDGYETVIGHGGISLSGGQRQRISIARALIRRPDIIIFDEATSALDAESEYRILEQLKKLADGCIVLVTTHRLNTLRIADQIFWFNAGRLKERGSFEDLLKSGGEFASVIQSGEAV